MFQDVLKPFDLQLLNQLLMFKQLLKYGEKKKRFFLKKWGKVSIYF